MHDIADLEGRGVPSVFVASVEFVDAAAAQCRALGFPAASVFVPHPIQDRSDAEMEALADAALDQIVAAVTAAGAGQAARAPQATGAAQAAGSP